MSFTGSNVIVTPQTARDHELADSGYSFISVNPTPGTGIVSASAPTSFSQTTPYLVIYNGGSTASIYLAYIRLLDTSVSTGGTGIQFTQGIDPSINRYSSGGTALVTQNTNANSTNTSGAVIHAGAVTAAAASASVRNLGNSQFRPVIDVAGDIYEFQYGQAAPTANGHEMGSTGVGHFILNFPAVVINPNSSYYLNLWKASMSGGVTFEVHVGWYEK